nr:T9SS type A sorting domain-containing protein [FCB group bacterium]
EIVRSGDFVVDLSQVEKAVPLQITNMTDQEILQNGGFETGDFPPWYHDGAWTVSTTGQHSGAYCAYDIGNHWLRQDFNPIPVSEIVSATIWARQPESAISCIQFHFSNLPTTSDLIWPTDQWQQFDLTSFITPGGIVTGIQVWGYSGGGPFADETFFDDVSIQTTAASNVQIMMIPAVSPIYLPPEGGTFEYWVEISNLETYPVICDAWTDAMLVSPDTIYFGPFLNRNITIAAGATIFRTLFQTVPGIAPDGIYHYYGRLGYYPGFIIYSEDYFVVNKGIYAGEGIHSSAGWNISGWEGDIAEIGNPRSFALYPPSPNPFNPAANLRYMVSEASEVNLAVFDVQGRLITTLVEGFHPAGGYEAVWNSGTVASGVYFFKLDIGWETFIQKGLLVK